MKFTDIHPSMTRDPWVRFLARMDEIHAFDEEAERPICRNCHEPVPCDTMRAFHIYSLEVRGGLVGGAA